MRLRRLEQLVDPFRRFISKAREDGLSGRAIGHSLAHSRKPGRLNAQRARGILMPRREAKRFPCRVKKQPATIMREWPRKLGPDGVPHSHRLRTGWSDRSGLTSHFYREERLPCGFPIVDAVIILKRARATFHGKPKLGCHFIDALELNASYDPSLIGIGNRIEPSRRVASEGRNRVTKALGKKNANHPKGKQRVFLRGPRERGENGALRGKMTRPLVRGGGGGFRRGGLGGAPRPPVHT